MVVGVRSALGGISWIFISTCDTGRELALFIPCYHHIDFDGRHMQRGTEIGIGISERRTPAAATLGRCSSPQTRSFKFNLLLSS